MYPSGQLLKSSDPRSPPSSTIGPRLESALLGNLYQRQNLPQYILAKSKRRTDINAFDDEESLSQAVVKHLDADDNAEPQGLLQGLLKTATDDLKLVGNVIKMALS